MTALSEFFLQNKPAHRHFCKLPIYLITSYRRLTTLPRKNMKILKFFHSTCQFIRSVIKGFLAETHKCVTLIKPRGHCKSVSKLLGGELVSWWNPVSRRLQHCVRVMERNTQWKQVSVQRNMKCYWIATYFDNRKSTQYVWTEVSEVLLK